METGIWFWNSNEQSLQPLSFVMLAGQVFLLLALTLMLILFVSRIVKSSREKKRNTIREQSQAILNTLIVHDSSGNQLPASFAYRIQELKAIAGTSTFGNNVIIHLLLHMRKSLSGSSSNLVREVYNELRLERYSLRKLKGLTWKKKALGIRELTEMQPFNCTPLIAKFIHSRNPILREESFAAMVRLETGVPLGFLHGYRSEITPWMQLTIHSYLRKRDPRTLPDFSIWFAHPNKSVRLFSIAMAAQFKQTGSLQSLATLLNDHDPEITIAAVDALATLEGYQFGDVVTRQLTNIKHEGVLIAFIRSLAKIGEPSTTFDSLQKYLAHENYYVRYQTVLTIKTLGNERMDELKKQNIRRQLQLDGLIAHLEEPLLQ